MTAPTRLYESSVRALVVVSLVGLGVGGGCIFGVSTSGSPASDTETAEVGDSSSPLDSGDAVTDTVPDGDTSLDTGGVSDTDADAARDADADADATRDADADGEEEQECSEIGESCTSDSDCCEGECRGAAGMKTCTKI